MLYCLSWPCWNTFGFTRKIRFCFSPVFYPHIFIIAQRICSGKQNFIPYLRYILNTLLTALSGMGLALQPHGAFRKKHIDKFQ